MSLRQTKAIAGVLFKEEPEMAKRFKEVIVELVYEGFATETVANLHEAFVFGWIDHTRPPTIVDG